MPDKGIIMLPGEGIHMSGRLPSCGEFIGEREREREREDCLTKASQCCLAKASICLGVCLVVGV